mmetsp:Transcript_877/g.2523  ORF Transcript_877/g.2523 Transcript_877/m.2523 type:complete len:277 (-) Transcript_877:6-836(-)
MVLQPKLPRSIVSCSAPDAPQASLISPSQDATLRQWRENRFPPLRDEADDKLSGVAQHACSTRSLSLRQISERGPRAGAGWHCGWSPTRRSRPRPPPPGKMRLTVLVTPKAHQVAVEVSCEATAAELKESVATELEEDWGAAAGDAVKKARLLHGGALLKDSMALAQAQVEHGSKLRLVLVIPDSSGFRRGHVSAARRGLLMTPGTKPWHPRTAREPRQPFWYEADAPYCANLQHPVLTPHPPVLPPKSLTDAPRAAAETRAATQDEESGSQPLAK